MNTFSLHNLNIQIWMKFCARVDWSTSRTSLLKSTRKTKGTRINCWELPPWSQRDLWLSQRTANNKGAILEWRNATDPWNTTSCKQSYCIDMLSEIYAEMMYSNIREMWTFKVKRPEGLPWQSSVRGHFTSTAGGLARIPSQGTKILHIMQFSQKKEKEHKERLCRNFSPVTSLAREETELRDIK